MARLVYKYERIPEGNEVGLLESVLIPLAAGCMGSLSQQASEQAGGGQTCGLKSAGLNIFSAINPYSFFVAQKLAETHNIPGKTDTLYPPVSPAAPSLLQTL